MTDTPAPASDVAPDYAVPAFLAGDFRVVSGANLGDPLLGTGMLCLDDVYRLAPDAAPVTLSITDPGSRGGHVLARRGTHQRVARGSDVGQPGAPLRLTARLTFLADGGHKVELLLIEMGASNGGTAFAAMPLDPIEPGRPHTLVGIDSSPDPVRLARITALAFARGTRITLADGRQAPVEELRPGTRLLTRENGAQPLRGVLQRTARTVGACAPVVIPAGTLGNLGDLVVGQQQRLFLYQRGEARLTGRAEMLVRAADLVDGERIHLRPGNYGDFFALVLDRHEVIYAECIPVDSLEVSAATLAALPEDLARDVAAELPGLSHHAHVGTEADRAATAEARERLLRDRAPKP